MNFNLIFGGLLASTNMLVYGLSKYPISFLSNTWRAVIVGFVNLITAFSKPKTNNLKDSWDSLSTSIAGTIASFTQPLLLKFLLIGIVPFTLLPLIINSNIMYSITNAVTFGNTRDKNGDVTLFGKILHSLVVGTIGQFIKITSPTD